MFPKHTELQNRTEAIQVPTPMLSRLNVLEPMFTPLNLIFSTPALAVVPAADVALKDAFGDCMAG
jgi:hypothetical protein